MPTLRDLYLGHESGSTKLVVLDLAGDLLTGLRMLLHLKTLRLSGIIALLVGAQTA